MTSKDRQGRLLGALLAAALVLPGAVSGLSLEDLVPAETRQELLEGNMVVTAQGGADLRSADFSPALTPRCQAVSDALAAALEEVDATVLVESLSLYSKNPRNNMEETWSDQERLDLLNTMLAISSMKGLEYYSTTRGKFRVLYEVSTVIGSPQDRTPRPDPVYQALPVKVTLYCRQKDTTFGDNLYQYEYRPGKEAIVMIQKNLTPLKAGLLTVVRSGSLRSVVAVIDAGTCLVVYIASLAEVAAFPGLGRQTERSFAARAEAVMKWFSARANLAVCSACGFLRYKNAKIPQFFFHYDGLLAKSYKLLVFRES